MPPIAIVSIALFVALVVFAVVVAVKIRREKKDGES